MRVAVLGVGLIGGSIGLAARERMGAEVAGFDPEPANLERGLELGALTDASTSADEAAAEADLVFCAAPVRALPEVVAAALGASGEATVVTDVGSTKRELVAALASHREASGSSADTRSPAPRRPASSTRAPTCSRARGGI